MAKGKDHFTRREFLSKSLSGITAAGLLSISGKKPPSHIQRELVQRPEKNIIYRTLGKTNIHLPLVSMGVMNTLDSAVVKKSYEIGVRHFDTAGEYMRGRNEEMLGNALKELNVRDKVIISTKVFVSLFQRGMNPEEMKKIYLKKAEESLKRLKTDYIDILYSHSVYDIKWLNNPGIIEALHLLKEQNKARFIGFTTHQNMAECINEAARTGFYDVVCNAFNYSMHDDEILTDSLKNAASKGIGLTAMKTQCGGQFLRLENVPIEKQRYYRRNVLHTAVLKWVLKHDFITTAIPGYTNYQQMEEDFSVAYDLDYTLEEKKFLQDRNVMLALKGYCQQCSRCVPTCPYGVDIPTLMRIHMYALCYSNLSLAQDTFNEIPNGKGLERCISCSQCEASCANRVDIANRIDELGKITAGKKFDWEFIQIRKQRGMPLNHN